MKFSLKHSGPLRRAAPYVTVCLMALMLADLFSTYMRGLMIPKAAPPAKPSSGEPDIFKAKGEYAAILSKNIFNSDGIIPNLQSTTTTVADASSCETARETSLPLKLVG